MDLDPLITNLSRLKHGLLVACAPGKTVGKMVAEFVGAVQFKDENVYLLYRRIQKLERSCRAFLEASDDGVVLRRVAINAFKEGIRPSYKGYLLEHSTEISCLDNAYRVANSMNKLNK